MPGPERRLAAILFSDIVGYTALMAESEARGLRVRERHRELLGPLAARYGGEIIDETGDELLLVFSSDLDAVNCALAAQAALRGDPDLALRIGIHAGDVIFETERIYGDGVNVAARIRPLAEPGGIAVSEPVFDAIKNQPDVETVSLGEQPLKNVPHPMAVYAVTGSPGSPSQRRTRTRLAKLRWVALGGAIAIGVGLIVLALPPDDPLRPQVEQPTSPGPRNALALLPFEDLSPEGDQQYFADGLCEEIINALTRVPGLRVAARTSSFTFRGEDRDVRAVATALGVGSVLEGSVRRDGNRLRISATLVDARDGLHLWSGRFDRELRDVFSIQEEIAVAVVEAIRGEVALEPADRILAARPPADLRTYELYLRGQRLLDQTGDSSAMRQAIELFEEAVQIDPHYASAHAALSRAHFYLWEEHASAPDLERALESSRRAVQLDPTLGSGHASLGWLLSFRADWSGALDSLERAVELDPGSAQAHRRLGSVLMMRGEKARALREVRRALRLDPLSQDVNYALGRFLLFDGRLDEGTDRLQRALRLNPRNYAARLLLSWGYGALGRERESVEIALPLAPSLMRPLLRAGARLFGRDFPIRTLHILAAWRSGDPCLPNPYVGAGMLAFLGDREATIRCLGESIERGTFTYMKVDPLFDPYRDDPRFAALLARVGLAD